MIKLNEFLEHLNSGEMVVGGSEIHGYMAKMSQEALKITMEINGTYHTPEEIRALFSRLIKKPVDASFCLFPPFYTDCGKNITLGKNVFINSGCHIQDQGGVFIGNNVLIGPHVVLATLNHDSLPKNRSSMQPAPIIIEENVWIGAKVVVLPGVRIGANAVVAAGAVVTKDVLKNTVVAGVPAKLIKNIGE